MKLITHLDPSQLRLGYLTCLSLVAGRQLDTRQGLVDRLCRFLFNMVDASDCRWAKFMEHVDKDELNRITPPEDDRMTALQELFRMKAPERPFLSLAGVMARSTAFAFALGSVGREERRAHSGNGSFLRDSHDGFCSVRERGVFAELRLAGANRRLGGAPEANPFEVRVRPALHLFFLYTLLTADIMTPFLIQEFSAQDRGDLPNAPKFITRRGRAPLSVGRASHRHHEHRVNPRVPHVRRTAPAQRGREESGAAALSSFI